MHESRLLKQIDLLVSSAPDTIIFPLWGSVCFPNRIGSCHTLMTAKLFHSRGCHAPPPPCPPPYLLLQPPSLLLPEPLVTTARWCNCTQRNLQGIHIVSLCLFRSFAAPKTGRMGRRRGGAVHSPTAGGSVVSQFHKVEHRLVSLISSEAFVLLPDAAAAGNCLHVNKTRGVSPVFLSQACRFLFCFRLNPRS